MLMEETITVTQLNTRVKNVMTNAPGVTDVWVTGEISNFKLYSSGHCYFTLKDNGSEIRCVMFKSAKARIDFEPTDNMEVAVYGSVDIYVERGSYQFMVQTMKRGGIGNLYAELEKLKRKLEAEGLFEQKRKRKLPTYPKVIGVVTSQSGAVIHDIITTSGRRFPADIILAPAKVQGEGAAQSIAAGIELLNRIGVDIIIVGRGGGSMEDLWAFNEERTVRAIAASKVPTISAVGHESDFTLSDLVADVRAATPTAAAEIALRDKIEIMNQLNNDTVRLNRALSYKIEKMRSRFNKVDSKLSPKRAEEMVAMKSMRLDHISTRLAGALRSTVEMMRRRYAFAEMRLEKVPENLIPSRIRTLENLTNRLEALDPYNVLGRGYSMVTDENGKALTSTRSVKKGKNIIVRMRDGSIDAEIKEVRPNDKC